MTSEYMFKYHTDAGKAMFVSIFAQNKTEAIDKFELNYGYPSYTITKLASERTHKARDLILGDKYCKTSHSMHSSASMKSQQYKRRR